MLKLPDGVIGREVALGSVNLTADDVRRYALAIGDRERAAGPCDIAPLGLAQALRGGPVPEIDLEPNTISVHAGHVITADRPLGVPAAYRLSARIADVFEKSGRSGSLTVIARRAELRSDDGALAASIEDQQIVRWRRPSGPPPTPHARPTHDTLHEAEREIVAAAQLDPRDDANSLEEGTELGRMRRIAPSAGDVATYSSWLGGGERMFTDRTFARSLGYQDVIVPGPLQSALMETTLRRWLPGWHLRRLSLTFRISVIAAEAIELSAVVVERHVAADRTTLVCDLSLENTQGDRAALGVAELVSLPLP